MEKYVRSSIIHYTKDNVYTTEEILNKYACQVFISCLHPEYLKKVQNGEDNFVCLIIGNTWEEVNNKFNEMNLLN